MTKHSFVKKTLITTLALSTLFTFAHAKGNWFVAGGVGVNINSKESSSANFTFKNTANFTLNGGYKTNNFGIALEYNQTDYATNKELKQTDNIILKLKQASVYIAPFIAVNVNTQSSIFLKVGFGYNWPSYKLKDADGKYNLQKSLAWKTGIGYQYSVNNNNAVMLEYNFINNGLKEFFGIHHSRQTHHNFNILYKYSFAS